MAQSDSTPLVAVFTVLFMVTALVVGVACVIMVNHHGSLGFTSFNSSETATDPTDTNASRAPASNQNLANNGDLLHSDADVSDAKRDLLAEADRVIQEGRKRTPEKRAGKNVDLADLSATEKNLLWWEIAANCDMPDPNQMRYKLPVVRARKLASKYETSVREIFSLFKEGTDADWRSDEAPPRKN